MNSLRGVLWDLDGVLVDSGEFHYESWTTTLKEEGIPFDREQFRKTFGMNNARVLEMLLGRSPEAELVAEVSHRKERRFRRLVRGRARLLPGAKEWLDRFQKMGVVQAIASSAPEENIDTLADELGIRPYFAALTSGADLPGKPDPAVFLKAAAAIGVAPPRCLVIEDAIAGVEAARRAGMKCIAVTTTNPAEALEQAELVVDRLADLPASVVDRMLPEVDGTASAGG